MAKQEEKNIPESGKKKGIVVSDSQDKSIVVEVTTLKTLKKYFKKYRDSKRYLVHDESNAHKVGETVEFQQSKPKSKRKRWTVVEDNK